MSVITTWLTRAARFSGEPEVKRKRVFEIDLMTGEVNQTGDSIDGYDD